jgi:Leucine-rich repeat (LRR) protein
MYCETNEKSSLVLLHSHTRGHTWTHKWNLSTDPCLGEWYGINCNEDGNVIRIHLYNNNLLGPIPKLFGRFKKLEYLHLGSNRLTGHIPESLASLTNLRFLNLANNMLVGDAPAFLSKLPRLKNLDISANNFTPKSLTKETEDLTASKGTKMEYTKFDNEFTNQIKPTRTPKRLSFQEQDVR